MPAGRAAETLRSPRRVSTTLLTQAKRIDREHRLRHSRPVSAETLRKEMRIGSARARALVKQVRALYDPAARATGDSGRKPDQRHLDSRRQSSRHRPAEHER